MQLSLLSRGATIMAFLALPLAANSTPVTFNMAAELFAPQAERAGSFTGAIAYDVETGLFSSAHILVSLIASAQLFELNFDGVEGESTHVEHKGIIRLQFVDSPGPTRPAVDFGGTFTFIDLLETAPPVTYSVRGTAASAVPEPATYALLGVGLAAAALARRRERPNR